MEKIYKKLSEEIAKAEQLADKAAADCKNNFYNTDSFSYYLQRVEYVKGLYMARTIIEKELKKKKIGEVK